MRESQVNLRALMLAAVLIWAGAATLYAQSSQTQPPPKTPPGQGQQNPPPATPPAAPPVNKEEEDAYKKFFEAKGDPQIPLGEDFLKKFPDSRYREYVYSRLAQDYLSAGKEAEMMAAGEKTLELNPDNVDVLALMAMVIPRRVNMSALDADQKLNKAEGYAKKSIAMIPDLPKPANVSDEDFTKAKNEKLSLAHSGLGFVYYLRGKFAESAAELAESTKLAAAPDPADFLVMGVALEQVKKYEEAATAYGKCAEMNWQMQARCKDSQGKAKKLATSAPKP